MNRLLLLAALAAGFAAGYLVGAQRETAPQRRNEGGPGEPAPFPPPPPRNGSTPGTVVLPRAVVELPDVAASAKARPKSPRTQKELATFVAACAARGAEAVPELLRLLQAGEDVPLAPMWSLVDGELREYPSLRAAYLEALRLIPGEAASDALRQTFGKAASFGESYFIALSLDERREGGFARELLERAGRSEGRPTEMHLVRAAAELAGRSDPAAAASYLEATAPRNDSRFDPQDGSMALATMPAASARGVALRLFADPAVTVLAKSRYVIALGRRPDAESLSILREALEGPGLQGDMRVHAANAAVNSPGISLDLGALDVARANRDSVAEGQALERLRQRIAEARRVVGAAFGVDPATTDDPRASGLLRKLDEVARTAGLVGR